MANKKPEFVETKGITTISLPYAGLKFNAQIVGPTTFNELREADYGKDNYGKGFWMPTMPEFVPLINASLENKEYDTAKNVVKTLKHNYLTGNTAIHYFPEGMFVEDDPRIVDGILITPTLKVLENRLGKHEEKRVVFSDDERVRFTPYDFKRGPQSVLSLVKNSGVIVFAGSEENAEELAKASEHYRKDPCFSALEYAGSPITRVASLDLGFVFDRKLIINANIPEDFTALCSYGVQGIQKEARNQKSN